MVGHIPKRKNGPKHADPNAWSKVKELVNSLILAKSISDMLAYSYSYIRIYLFFLNISSLSK